MPPVPPSALSHLPTAWQDILRLLKRRGEARAEALAQALGMTPSGIRQHLTCLERDGLVQHREHREGPGRPRHLYALTAAADGFFPRAYAELMNELLDYASDEDADLVGRLFSRRAERRLADAQARTVGKPFAEQVAAVADLLDEDGYLAQCEERPDGSFLLTEHNCAVLGVAQRFGHACSSELEFLRGALPGAEVERESHILSGAHACAYAIRPAVSP